MQITLKIKKQLEVSKHFDLQLLLTGMERESIQKSHVHIYYLYQVRRNTSSSSEESMRAAPMSAKEYVESLHQNSKSTLLYGKNNVMVQPVSFMLHNIISSIFRVFCSCMLHICMPKCCIYNRYVIMRTMSWFCSLSSL